MKNVIFLSVVVSFFLGCSFLNTLPNPQRDKWYMEHAEEDQGFNEEALGFFKKVEIGFTKSQVIESWGEPLKKKTDDYWIYKFPKYFPNPIKVRFENNVVVEKW